MMAAPGIGGTPSSTRTGVVPAGLSLRNSVAPLPAPFFDEAGREAEFLQDQPHETRMRAKGMMEQRQHAVAGALKN